MKQKRVVLFLAIRVRREKDARGRDPRQGVEKGNDGDRRLGAGEEARVDVEKVVDGKSAAACSSHLNGSQMDAVVAALDGKGDYFGTR